MISETAFSAALERAVNAPERCTRLQRINSGDVVIDDARHGKRRIRGAKKGTGDFVGYATVKLAPWASASIYTEVEAKAADGTLKPEQKARMKAIRAAGGIYLAVWADKFDLDKSVREALAALDDEIAKFVVERLS